MPKSLAELTEGALNNRIDYTDERLYILREELARRERISVYGTDTPELDSYTVEFTTWFELSIRAADEADALRIAEDSDWLRWCNTAPGGAVRVFPDDYTAQVTYGPASPANDTGRSTCGSACGFAGTTATRPPAENYYFGHGMYTDPDEVYAPDEFDKFRYCDTGELVSEAAPRACLLCGEFQTRKGHDPCIANLPGVRNACCGHGVERAYVQFNNGLVIRGHFDHVAPPVSACQGSTPR